jgi:hypothetical protein
LYGINGEMSRKKRGKPAPKKESDERAARKIWKIRSRKNTPLK